MRKLIILVFALLVANQVSAAGITLYQAPDNTYQNTTNNPCLFFGPGLSGCSQDPANWPAALPKGDTGGGDPFNPNPLTYSFAGSDLLAFRDDVGADFLLGLDINDTSTPQTLSNVTVNAYNNLNVLVASYTFGPPLLVPDISNGVGFADYILAPGCTGVSLGSGNSATCTNYTPFHIPTATGVSHIDFSFGLMGFNDGPDKLFLIDAGPGGVPTPFCVDPNGCDVTAVPEPSSMLLIGSGLIGLIAKRKKQNETKVNS